MFTGGQVLNESKKWLETIEFLQKNGHSPKPFIRNALRNGGIDILSREWTNQKPPFQFRNQTFHSKDALLNATFPNSPAVHQNSKLVWAEISRLRGAKVIRRVSREDAMADGSVVNPLHWFAKTRDDGTVKHRLVMQPLINALYTSPKFTLPDIVKELRYLAPLDKLVKDDMRDCFYVRGGGWSLSSYIFCSRASSFPSGRHPSPHQYPVDQASSRLLRFMMIDDSGDTSYFEFATLIMGVSCASYAVQHLNEILTSAFSLLHKGYVNVYTGWICIPARIRKYYTVFLGLNFKIAMISGK